MFCQRVIVATTFFSLAACTTVKTSGVAVGDPSVSSGSGTPLEAMVIPKSEIAKDDNGSKRGERIDHLCFTSSISGFRDPGDGRVIVSRGRDDYLVETFGWCPDLDFAHGLAFKSFGACLSRGDTLIAFDSLSVPRVHRANHGLCRIKAIYEWREEPPTGEADKQGTGVPDGDGLAPASTDAGSATE